MWATVNAAEESAHQANRSADAAERSAALETQASIASEQEAAEQRTPWVLEPVRGSDKIFLHNRTATPKYAVLMEGPAVKAGLDSGDVGNVDGNGIAEVDTLLSIFRDPSALLLGVTMTWHRMEDLSDPPLAWHSVLPRD